MIKEINESGRCPMCGSYDLDYDALELGMGGDVYYPWTCLECGATGDEYYDISFVDIESYNGDIGYDEGVCPVCGKYVDYGVCTSDGDQMLYDYMCRNCRNNGVEVYDLEFSGQYIDD